MPAAHHLHFKAFHFAFAAAIFFVAAQASAVVVIDDFSIGPITVARTGATVATATQTGLDPAHVLGGRREITVGAFGAATQTLIIDVVTGEFQASVVGTPGYFTIKYGSDAQPLNLNLLALGNGFLFETLAPPSAVGRLPDLRLYSSSGSGHVDATDGVATATPSGGTAIFVPFSEISPSSFGTLDLTAITSIQIDDGRVSTPIRLSSVSIVPEPSTLALLAAATLAGGLATRRPRSPVKPAKKARRMSAPNMR